MLFIFWCCNRPAVCKQLTTRLQFVLFDFAHNTLSGTEYRAGSEGVSLMDETNIRAGNWN